MMKKHLITALLMTFWSTILLGLIYPLVVTAGARLLFPDKARGQIILHNGTVIGSRIIGQPFTGPRYFHSRPSAAGNAGYDAANSQGSNLGPTNRNLIDRVNSDIARLQSENPGAPVPADLVTTSASGLDPDISPAAAEFQVPRVARECHLTEDQVRQLIRAHTQPRQLGFLGEPRVNVLELNLALREVLGPGVTDVK
ncbi:MAG TPA: potassium-transporting ATPase subunit KdpC [Terriglobales bacterium]|nr:potassium-transporting ATPase subunit KdpC [Terriglobales bacterium]